MSNRPTVIETRDGIGYVVDTEKVSDKWRYLKSKFSRGKTLDNIINEIADEAHYSPSTVKGWLSGVTGTRSKEAVDIIAKYLGCDRWDLLKPLVKENKNMTKQYEEEKEERDAARKLYGEFCDMLQILNWESLDVIVQFPGAAIAAWGWYRDQYEAREHYLLLIRKASMDLPEKMRRELTDLVNDAFDLFDDCADPPYELNTSTDDYKKKVEKKKGKEQIEATYLYVKNYRDRISDRLDSIFDPYIRR